MNIGDYVYVYLFDLEKSIEQMQQLREDRFGKIVNISELKDINRNEFIKVYSIELLNKKVISYRTDSLLNNMASIGELIEIIGRANIDSEKRQFLLDQLNEVLS